MLPGLFAFTSFLGSFLVFLVQPMVGKWLLPTFGGAPAIWTTSLFFFQAALFGGYLLAHLGLTHLSARRQSAFHIGSLLIGILWLPPLRESLLRRPVGESPFFDVVAILGIAIGWVFTVLTAGSPILQAWYARLGRFCPVGVAPVGSNRLPASFATPAPCVSGPVPGEPWMLYAAGNAGSLLALFCYPFLIESTFSLQHQNLLWSGAYLLLVTAWVLCAWNLRKAERTAAVDAGPRASPGLASAVPPGWRQCLRWLSLAALPSALLNSQTGYLTTDIAPIPLLWVAPLAMYLLSFVIAFSGRGAHLAQFPGPVVVLVLGPLLLTLDANLNFPLWLSIGHHLVAGLTLFLLFHGLLVRERPDPCSLTRFYLWISLGGMIGGMASSFVAPLLLVSHIDYPLLLLAGGALTGILPLVRESAGPAGSSRLRSALHAGVFLVTFGFFLRFAHFPAGFRFSLLVSTIGGPFFVCVAGLMRFRWFPPLFALGMAINLAAAPEYGTTLLQARNFFGSVRIAENAGKNARFLFQGNICHGAQGTSEELIRTPLAYYPPNSSVHQIFSWLKFRNRTLQIGVVGLGTGAMAAFTRPGDTITFFEIDPKIVRIAKDPAFFTYVTDCRGTLRITEKDGRLGIRESPEASFDLLVLDAYSSDAIPIHLLTREAVAEYLTRLKPGGILVFHLSNRYLDLLPVIANISTVLGLAGWAAHDEPQLFPDPGTSDLQHSLSFDTIWAVVFKGPHPIRALFDDLAWRPLGVYPSIPFWTDDRASIIDLYTWQ